jgi:threonine dehydrogenase-like Zn-dependent dehydrogenase
MKALVFNGPRDIRYETYDDPIMGTPNGAIVKVSMCSICGSDLHMYHGDTIGRMDYGGTSHRFCTGHEFIGEVVEAGPHTHTLKVGDKVLAQGGTGVGCARTAKAAR